MNKIKATRHLALALAASIISGNALADSDHNEALKLKEAGEILPLEQIIIKARQLHSGHILEIELERENNHYIYELEILDGNGTLWELKYDAKSGDFINSKRDG